MQCLPPQRSNQTLKNLAETLQKDAHYLNALAQHLQMIANTQRLKILWLLWKESALCVCELSQLTQLSFSATSQHLKKLKEDNWVVSWRQGKTIFYQLSDKGKQWAQYLFTSQMETV